MLFSPKNSTKRCILFPCLFPKSRDDLALLPHPRLGTAFNACTNWPSSALTILIDIALPTTSNAVLLPKQFICKLYFGEAGCAFL